MLAAIPLTDDGHTAVDALLARLADVPTPAGPTPHQIGVPPTVTLLPIVPAFVALAKAITTHRASIQAALTEGCPTPWWSRPTPRSAC